MGVEEGHGVECHTGHGCPGASPTRPGGAQHRSDNINEFVILLMGQHKHDATFCITRARAARFIADEAWGGLGLGLRIWIRIEWF